MGRVGYLWRRELWWFDTIFGDVGIIFYFFRYPKIQFVGEFCSELLFPASYFSFSNETIKNWWNWTFFCLNLLKSRYSLQILIILIASIRFSQVKFDPVFHINWFVFYKYQWDHKSMIINLYKNLRFTFHIFKFQVIV